MKLLVLLVGVFALQASSQTLPCQLTGGTSCPTMICPNTAVNYTCNVGSFAGSTVWNVPSVGVCSEATLSLVQAPLVQGQSCLSGQSSSGTCGPFTVTNTPPLTSTFCLSSTLSVVVTSAMNGLVVSCSSYSQASATTTPVGNATISVVAPPSAPTITLSDASSNKFTVTWTSVSTATSYNVSINDCTPLSLPANTSYTVSIGNGSILISSSGPLTRVLNCTNIMNNSVYTVSVVAINCAGGGSPAIKTAMLSATSSSLSVSTSIAGSTQPLVLTTIYVLKPSNEPATTNAPTTTLQSSTSSPNAVGIGVGVSVGFVALLLLVGIAVVIGIILIKKKGSPATPKGDNYEQNEIPLPPKNTDKAPSKPEGLIYADIGLPSRVPMQAPNPRDLSSVTYSTVSTVKELL